MTANEQAKTLHRRDVGATPAGTNRSTDVQSWLDRLRARVATLKGDAEIDRLLWGLSEAAEQILSEHAGMAEELLGVYEQLGIVFEATRKLPTVQRESEVVDVFLDNLRRSLDRRAVFVVRSRVGGGGCEKGFSHQRRGGWSAQGTDLEIGEWANGLFERARDSATVQVEEPPAGAMSATVVEVMVGPVFAGEEFVCAIVLARGHGVPEFRSSDMLLLESLTTFCGDLIRNHRLVRELREMCFAMVRSLVNAVDQKDTYTRGHSVRVGYFAALLGKRLNLTEADLQMLQWSALLHDVGKIGIRDDVLKKEGKLTEEEFNHIKEHPVRSHKVVQGVSQLAGALDGVLHHHEHYDGEGYPSQLAKEEIPLQARIIQIADVFDALTSDRSYRAAYDWRKALAILKEEAGRTVDPSLCRVFDGLIRELLEDDGAWERLAEQATRFTQTAEDLPPAGCRCHVGEPEPRGT